MVNPKDLAGNTEDKEDYRKSYHYLMSLWSQTSQGNLKWFKTNVWNSQYRHTKCKRYSL